MTPPPAFDPAALFRDAVAQWEKAANEYGTQLLARPEAAAAMHKATAAGMQAQTVVHEAMAKMLAAANMPTHADIVALNERIGRIEASLARIEAALPAAPASAAPARPRPSRGRKPPQ